MTDTEKYIEKRLISICKKAFLVAEMSFAVFLVEMIIMARYELFSGIMILASILVFLVASIYGFFIVLHTKKSIFEKLGILLFIIFLIIIIHVDIISVG